MVRLTRNQMNSLLMPNRRRLNNRRVNVLRRTNINNRMNNMRLNQNPMNRVKNIMISRNLRNIRRRSNNMLPTINYETPLSNREIANQLNIQRATNITPINTNTIRATRQGEVVISNREFQGTVTPGINYFNFKPGYSGLMALDYQSLGFDNYIVHSVIYEFRSNKSSATNGRVVMAFDYEGNPPSDVRSIMASDRSKTTNVYKNTNYITKVGSLMKQKLHAVAHDDSQSTSQDGTPTTCGTLVVFVDGLDDAQSGPVGSIFCTYSVCLKNFHGITSSGMNRINQIVSQNVTSNGSPSLTPPTVIQEDTTITPIEINANDTSANALVDGYQLDQNPNIGDNFTVVTTPNGSNLQPTIRIRSSDGKIIPASYYKLSSEPSTIKNADLYTLAPLKLYVQDENLEIEVGSFITLFFTTVSFIKAVADFISPVAKVILEVVKPFVPSDSNAEPQLLDQFSAITKGTEIDITLPDSEASPLIDNINTMLSGLITVSGPDNTRSISRNDYNTDSIPINAFDFIANRQVITLTTTNTIFDQTEGSFSLTFNLDNTDQIFKVGNLYQINTLYSSISNRNDSGSFSVSIKPYLSDQVVSVPSSVNDLVKYFTIIGPNNPATVGLEVILDDTFITNFITAADIGTSTREVAFIIQISEQVDVLRQQAISTPQSINNARLR